MNVHYHSRGTLLEFLVDLAIEMKHRSSPRKLLFQHFTVKESSLVCI